MQTNKCMILWDSFAEKISSQCSKASFSLGIVENLTVKIDQFITHGDGDIGAILVGICLSAGCCAQCDRFRERNMRIDKSDRIFND